MSCMIIVLWNKDMRRRKRWLSSLALNNWNIMILFLVCRSEDHWKTLGYVKQCCSNLALAVYSTVYFWTLSILISKICFIWQKNILTEKKNLTCASCHDLAQHDLLLSKMSSFQYPHILLLVSEAMLPSLIHKNWKDLWPSTAGITQIKVFFWWDYIKFIQKVFLYYPVYSYHFGWWWGRKETSWFALS